MTDNVFNLSAADCRTLKDRMLALSASKSVEVKDRIAAARVVMRMFDYVHETLELEEVLEGKTNTAPKPPQESDRSPLEGLRIVG